MLYLHFCSLCSRIHILSGHRIQCPACDNRLSELSIPYEKYIKYNPSEREALLKECSNPHSLNKIELSYVARYTRKQERQ